MNKRKYVHMLSLLLVFCMLFSAMPVSAASVDKDNFQFSEMLLKRVWFQNSDPIFLVDHYNPVELVEGLNVTGIGTLTNITEGAASDGYLAPLKEFFRQVGGTYEEQGDTVTMSLNGDTLVMTVGSTNVTLKGQSLPALPAASKPQRINVSSHSSFGSVNPLVASDVTIIYLPVRYILNAFGASLYWDSGQASIYAVVKVLTNKSNMSYPDKQGSRLDQIFSLDPVKNSEKAQTIAANIIALQNDDGGFMKLSGDIDMAQSKLVGKIGTKGKSSIETIAGEQVSTVTELRYLAKMITAFPGQASQYTPAFYKGIQYLLDAQMDNGGWSIQKNGIGYNSTIAYADNAMISVLTLFNDVARLNDQQFVFVRNNNQSLVSLMDKALQKGIDCIVKTQIQVNGTLTGWSSHHHPVNLSPVIGKTYERPGINATETTRIAQFLMNVRNPSNEVKAAAEAAVNWLTSVKINDKIMITVSDITMNNGIERYLVDQPGHVTWARNYKVSGSSFVPFFSDRQITRGDIPLMNFNPNDPREVIGQPGASSYYSNYTVAAKIMFYDTRTAYEWYVETPKRLIETDYVTWKNRLANGWPALPVDPSYTVHRKSSTSSVDPVNPVDPSDPVKAADLEVPVQSAEPTKPGTVLESTTGVVLSADPSVKYITGYSQEGGKRFVNSDGNIKRSEVAYILFQLSANLDKKEPASKSSFKDVASEHWAYGAIQYFAAKGLFKGYEDGTFMPDKGLSRAEVASILSTFYHDKGTFKADLKDIQGHWAQSSIELLVSKGIIQGYSDSTFKPDGTITRAELIALVNRVLGRSPAKGTYSAGDNPFTDLDSTHWAYEEIISAAQ
ncbi:pectate lyase [Paenibacillus radicis (ex Xue et al. 2023)]|uniref:S-layer homology domain-containing protein n=1 Tax=Paenibacillus radicis (ex Xue et al. 2023) TaxID=2972489 RepID=A0ABT1YCG6_9BACL|nr:pectate lyase [Paenibacillus radicis (ex Xue et al. 2023)]MCR8630104.1 S-layer homology domain-containing protein [Paenibacillus radicis (ex Xue et al. 2023)]